MSFFFEQFPEFIEEDNRSRRGSSPVTIETISNRLSVIAPASLIHGKTVLDLGSCLGAAGQWCLANGARHYTGVEIQKIYTDKSHNLLQKNWSEDQFEIIQQDVLEFLNQTRESQKTYDVVLALGVIYAFVDTFEVLSLISSVCSGSIVIESLYPPIMLNESYPVIHINPAQYINASATDGSYVGVGAVPSPDALNILMKTNGFINNEGMIYPRPAPEGIHDAYLRPISFERVNYQSEIKKFPSRFIQRYEKSSDRSKTASEVVAQQDENFLKPFPQKPVQDLQVGTWKFDESVAERFQKEALLNIPDYHRVIELCLETAEKKLSKEARILDVGSALGHTIRVFSDAGFSSVYGVENSSSMIERSYKPEVVEKSDKLPAGPWDMILANWTLHFINDRFEYLKNIVNSLRADGLLIITEKMNQSEDVKNLYYDFKKSNGMSEEEIINKEKALQGILTTKNLSWYLTTLEELGLSDITVINARLGFVTIMAKKWIMK